jgi:hypothetical protein
MCGTIISRKIVKPEDCVLCFGIPTTGDEFLRKLECSDSGFASLFSKKYGHGPQGLNGYRREFLEDLEEIEPVLVNLDLQVVHETQLQDLRRLLCESNYDVVIVFSHWEKNAIELADGFAQTTVLLDQIPQSFSGIIDLCVCNPEPLTTELRLSHPNVLIRYSKGKAKPYFWLYFYRVLFEHLKQQNVTYLKAVEDVVREFSKTSRGRPFYERLTSILRSLFEKARKNRRDSAGGTETHCAG